LGQFRQELLPDYSFDSGQFQRRNRFSDLDPHTVVPAQGIAVTDY
jgi:hypothetical protein